MKKSKLISMLLAIVLCMGGLVNSSTAAVTAKDYTEEELDSSTYDLRKYTTPFWEGNIVYNEIVYPIASENGLIENFSLMYEPTEIISVKNYRLDITYEKGKDYHIVNGELYIPATSAIETFGYEFIHVPKAPANYGDDEISPYYPQADGEGYEYWVGGTEICDKAIAVTYIHNGKWNGPVPESQADALPRTMEMLMAKEDLTVVVAGDSVSTGAMGSGFLGISPYADAYPEMTVKALREKFGYDGITLVNSAIGGTMSYFDETKMNNTIINHSPDLVILNFGMNDSSCDRVGISGEEFHDNLAKQIDYIKEKLPECEVLLVSSLYGNRFTFPAERYEEHAAVLHTLADEYKGQGVGVCDPQSVEKYLIEEREKDFLCFMADNMVHPGDFGMRLMAQSILNALDVDDIESYKDSLIKSLWDYADPDSHIEDGKKDELETCIGDIVKEMEDLDDEWDINIAVNAGMSRLESIVKRCKFEDHVFARNIIPSTCKEPGYTRATCKVCGFEYDYNPTPALGGEHIMDNGINTTTATYKQSGIITYSCAKCSYTEEKKTEKLSNPPDLTDQGMLYVANSYNYMAGVGQPYRDGSGFIELDICPLDINVEGTPYVGVWFSGYSITACYNFRKQQVEITGTNLPYSSIVEPYAYKKIDWTTDGGEFDYNWKKFAVNIEGNTVRIYLNGELVLEDTNKLYHAVNEIPLLYTIGEFYIDNIKVAKNGYDPVTGEGSYLNLWDFDSEESVDSFGKSWGLMYSEREIVIPNAGNNSTGTYKNHKHILTYMNTVQRGCANPGYKEYSCDLCGQVMRIDVKSPIHEHGHTLTGRYVMEAPTEQYSGRYGYSCENCYMTFTQKIPANSPDFPVVKGDFDNDGVFNYLDVEYLRRYLVGIFREFDKRSVDFDNDGSMTSIDFARVARQKQTNEKTA